MDFEDMFRRIIREELDYAVEKLRHEMQKPDSELPPALSVEQAAEVMGVGITKAYEMARRADFPKIKDGGRTIIPTQALLKWMNETALKAVGH